MDFGIMFFASLATGGPAAHYDFLLQAARIADSNRFTAIWTPERHFDEFGGIFPNPALTSAALAMVTTRIGVRAGSIISPLHDALPVAEDWAVVDNLSAGRVALSFGSGWNPDDFVLNAAAYRTRSQTMWEQIGVIRHLWSGGKIERPNGVGAIVPIALVPRPVQAELPIWVTTGGTPETFVRAGAAGTNVLTHLITQDLDLLAERILSYRTARAEAGLDPAAGRVTAMVHTFVGATDDEVRSVVTEPLRCYLRSALQLDLKAKAGGTDHDGDLLEELLSLKVERYFDGLALLGDAAKCRAVVANFEAAGIDEVACLLDFGIDSTIALAGLRRLCNIVNAPDLPPIT